MIGENKRSNNNINGRKNVQKMVFSVTLVSSLIMFGNLASASSLSESQSSNVTASNADITYNDFQSDQYWAQDMLWAIDKGLIRGYVNQGHPSTKKYGNWLNPYGALTESQMLTVVLRYAKPAELGSTKSTNTKFFASIEYQLAQKYNLPTKGSLTNTAPATKPVTRGTLAQTLASLYFSKQISMKNAVQFMYDAGISNGYSNKEGFYPKTYDSYGVNDTLTRAHIVTFIKKHDDFINSGRVISPPKDSASPIVPPNEQVVNGIKVNYGKHTYGSKTQAHYDQVMQIVTSALELKYNDIVYSPQVSYDKYHDEYINGARGTRDRTSPDYYTERNRGLLSAENNIGGLVKAGLGKEDIIKLKRGGYVFSTLISGKRDPLDGSPESAYDALVRDINDCDSEAQVMAAVLDTMGYNTAILVRPGHANMFVEVQGKWFDIITAEQIDMRDIVKNGLTVHTQPTNGDIINPDGSITKH
ncbi:MAG TPA: S-layer homology domain-containing protein [Bacillus sp. (in: firmicutes)]|nr:S-layer homology domain-containing protein [Bacillus sp. (in: firmicutes)]